VLNHPGFLFLITGYDSSLAEKSLSKGGVCAGFENPLPALLWWLERRRWWYSVVIFEPG